MIKHILKLIWNNKSANGLMILEILLSFLVLFCILAYVFFNLTEVNKSLGFSTEDTWSIALDDIENLDSLESVRILQNLKQNLLAEEEIESVSFTKSVAPFTHSAWMNGTKDNGFQMFGMMVPCDIDLGSTLSLNIIEGRWFEEADLHAAIEPIIVNKNFMDAHYPGQSMIDSVFIFGGDRKLIGVIDEYKYMGQFDEARNVTFSLYPFIENMNWVMLKMRPDTPASYEASLSALVNRTTKTTGSTISQLNKRNKENSRESWLMFIALLSVCGFLCINVALGLFGVLWYNINKRKSEIGLRQALGAHGSDITKHFILEMMLLAIIALTIGIFFAIQIPLLDVTEYDDMLFYKAIAYAFVTILALVFMCALFPSFQAARIKPAHALHED